MELLSRTDVEETQLRERLVQKAYECVESKDVHELLEQTYGPGFGSKLWRTLKFVARPIIDCRILSFIAMQYPQFRKTRILLVPRKPKTSIGPGYRISITRAWTQLTSDAMPHLTSSRLAQFNAEFKQDCAASYCLHAEMQLIVHYGDNPALNTSIPYFGCSKKSCLLCEVFLRCLPQPISTRGRHGVCYPAWGVPSSNSNWNNALRSLENMLVTRCKALMESTAQVKKALFTQAVPQSTLVSSFSEMTLQGLSQTGLKAKRANETQDDRRNERLIL